MNPVTERAIIAVLEDLARRASEIASDLKVVDATRIRRAAVEDALRAIKFALRMPEDA